MATLDSIDLGDIQSERQVKDSGLFQQAKPRNDSDNTILSDLLGTNRTITIGGTYTGTTKTALRTFITQIESISNGQQDGSSYAGGLMTDTKTVLIQSFDWDYSQGTPLKIVYTLTLIQGSVLSV